MPKDPYAPDYVYGQGTSVKGGNDKMIADTIDQMLGLQQRSANEVEPLYTEEEVHRGILVHTVATREVVEKKHLQILTRYRDEVKANLDYRKRWVIESEAQLEALDEAISRLKGEEGGGDPHE